MTNQVRILASVKDEVSGPLGKIIDKFERFQKQGAKGFAIGVGAFAAAKGFSVLESAVSGVIQFMGDSAQKASDLNETLSKSKVVFGDSAKSVEAWGATLAKSFGISKRAGIEAAASFGNVFTGMGFARDEAAKMSQSLVELAGDLASFNNISTDDALLKLRSGLAGEAEPLRSMGVFLNEATVKAKAMELGLADASGELTEAAKVTARYKLILEQTTTAQGDFARTADDLANSQRSATAQLEDAQAKLGKNFLPVELAVTKAQVELVSGLSLMGTTLDVLTGKVDLSTMSMEDQAAILDMLAGSYPAFEDVATQAHEAVAKAANEDRIQTVAMKGAAKDLGNAASGPAATGLGDLTDELGAAARAAKKAEDKVESLADELIDHLFGDAVAAGERAGIAQDIDDTSEALAKAKRHLKELEDIPHPTKKQREDIEDTQREVTILTGDLAKSRGELMKLDHDMAKADGPEALKKWYDKVSRSLAKGDKEGEDFLAQMRAIDNFSDKLPKNAPVFFGTVYGKNTRGKALGGPVRAFEPYVVGEKGPELFVPGASGSIIPNDKLRNRGGGGTGGGGYGSPAPLLISVNVNASGVMTPATARTIGDELGPILYDYLYRRGAVGRAA